MKQVYKMYIPLLFQSGKSFILPFSGLSPSCDCGTIELADAEGFHFNCYQLNRPSVSVHQAIHHTAAVCSKLRAGCTLTVYRNHQVKPGISRCDFTFRGVEGSVCPCSQCCCQQLVKQHNSLLFSSYLLSSALRVAQKYCTLI